MYSMTLDSVREKNDTNQLMSEAALMRAALLGNPVVLSPNQAMDSMAIKDIVLGNCGHETNYFCEAVRLGLVRVSIPISCRDLVDYCISALQRGIESQQNEFILSGLRFLYNRDIDGKELFPYQQRRELYLYFIEKLRNGRREFVKLRAPEWLSAEENNMVDQYAYSLVLLDRAVENYKTYSGQKQLFVVFLARILDERMKTIDVNSPLAKLIIFVRKKLSQQGCPVYRSYYYRLVQSQIKVYGNKAALEVKNIIDIAYNQMAAFSIEEDSEVSIDKDNNELANTVISRFENQCAFMESYTTDVDNREPLNWEMLVWIYQQIKAIMKEKGLEWQEAVYELYRKESNLPFAFTGKYLFVTSIKIAISSFIPGLPVADIISDLITEFVGNEVDSFISEKANLIGSFREMRTRTKKSKNVVNVLDTFVYSEFNDRIDRSI